METYSALLALCAGNSPVPVNSPHKGQWHRALMFYLICARINDWINNREAGDLKGHRGHYDVNVMQIPYTIFVCCLCVCVCVNICIRMCIHIHSDNILLLLCHSYCFLFSHTIFSYFAGNAAYNKFATQAKNVSNNHAGLAVDGNQNAYFSNCAHTIRVPGYSNWWQVDLGATYVVQSINITNVRSNNCCQSEYTRNRMDK